MGPKLGLRFAVRLSAFVLASCTALTGVNELVVDDDGAPIGLLDGGGDIVDPGTRDGDPGEADGGADGATSDAGVDANVTCDEPGLIAYWRLDEGSGIDTRDCTANKLDGKIEAGTWVQGPKGFALTFDGGFVGLGDPALLNKTGAFTVMAWSRLEPSDAGGVSQYIVGKTVTAGANGWRLATQGAQYAVSISGDGGSAQTFAGAVALSKWTHVAAVYIPGTAVEIYVDGVRLIRNVNAKSPSLIASPAELRIGTKGDGAYPFTGAIDDVRLYDRALSEAEIAARAVP